MSDQDIFHPEARKQFFILHAQGCHSDGHRLEISLLTLAKCHWHSGMPSLAEPDGFFSPLLRTQLAWPDKMAESEGTR